MQRGFYIEVGSRYEGPRSRRRLCFSFLIIVVGVCLSAVCRLMLLWPGPGRRSFVLLKLMGPPRVITPRPAWPRHPRTQPPAAPPPGQAATWKWSRGSRKPSRKMISKTPVVITLTLRLEKNEDELLSPAANFPTDTNVSHTSPHLLYRFNKMKHFRLRLSY